MQQYKQFQPTRPLRGATLASDVQTMLTAGISTHAPLAGRDPSLLILKTVSTGHFNPRAPCGARPLAFCCSCHSRYFNPRAPCGARRTGHRLNTFIGIISTHAPLAGRDLDEIYQNKLSNEFQPTRPLRGATYAADWSSQISLIFQPTRPLRGATHISPKWDIPTRISTHAPLAGRDDFISCISFALTVFQPTRPLRGAT